ncbi:MAG TPA: hypothetical protein VJV23_01330 [Candidatus Polarisedimenticolia bacterium]|nr:hypothetical protein [Candidatus Polarisedimenticolia bacterium]
MHRFGVLTTALSLLAAAPAQGPPDPGLELTLAIEGRALQMVGTISDVDVLADGRIALLDHDAMRVAIFTSQGAFERWLDLPRGTPPSGLFLTRLAALPEGGLVLPDGEGNRFFFYDRDLRPGPPVPFGIAILSLNGLARHPAGGDLYLVGYSPDNGRILHRYDASGRHLGSAVAGLDLPEQDQGLSTGHVAVDPADGSLWLSRLTPYEILHLSPEGDLLQEPIRMDTGSLPRRESVGPGLYRLGGFHTALKLAVIGGEVVGSYLTEDGRTAADVFRRDGSLARAGLTAADPRALAKRLENGAYVRHFNRERRVELWRMP